MVLLGHGQVSLQRNGDHNEDGTAETESVEGHGGEALLGD